MRRLLPFLVAMPLLASCQLLPWNAVPQARLGFLPAPEGKRILQFDLTNLREVDALNSQGAPSAVASTLAGKLVLAAVPAAGSVRAWARRGFTDFADLGDVPVGGAPQQVVIDQFNREALVTLPAVSRIVRLTYTGYQAPPRLNGSVDLPEAPVAVSTSNGDWSAITRRNVYDLQRVDGQLQPISYPDLASPVQEHDYRDLSRFSRNLLVTDAAQDALLVFDSGRRPRVIPLQRGGQAARPGRVVTRGPVAYVACSGTNTIAVVDLEAGEVMGHVSLGITPADLAWSDLESRLYVTSAASPTLTVIRRDDRPLLSGRPTFTETVEKTIPLTFPVTGIQATSNPFFENEVTDPPAEPAVK